MDPLDFTSVAFEPLLALSSGLEPPVDAAALDNVAKCRVILPSSMPESLANMEKHPKANEASKAKAQSFKERAQTIEERVKSSCSMSLETIISYVKPGPVRMLVGFIGTRVRVVTKHARGIRGEATGTLVAFDKFVNVVLRDVEEKYNVRLLVEKSPGGGMRPKLDQRKRSLPLVMIKGDSLVTVSRAEAKQGQETALAP